LLIAGAGGSFTPPGPLEDTSEEEGWRASVDGNLTATFLTIKGFLPGMKERRRGSIITSGSALANHDKRLFNRLLMLFMLKVGDSHQVPLCPYFISRWKTLG
jgi:NAD(P)-dependent dehydrogenase (short-subunit alcohol dehydrogenase family)